MRDTRVLVLGQRYPELDAALADSTAELTVASADATAIIASFGTSAQELRDAVGSDTVQWVQLPSAGIEFFASSLSARPDLLWTSAKGAYARPVAEHALALTLAQLRKLPTRVRANSWVPASGTSLHGLRVAIIGAGGVALEILRLVKSFDTHVTVVRRLPDPVPGADATVDSAQLESVLPQTDVLIVAAALTGETQQLLGASALETLPRHAHIVNIARGGLIDTEALVEALAAGRIAGAALDVTDPEPLPDGHPLWDEPRALITPHAADTIEMIRPLYAARVAGNVRRFSAGDDLDGVVDPRAGY